MVTLPEKLGFVVNYQNSQLHPTVNRISGFLNKFNYTKHQPSIGQSKKNQKRLSESCGKSRHHDNNTSSAPRQTRCFNPGSIPSTPSLSSDPRSQKVQSSSSLWLRVPSMLDCQALVELKWWRDHLSAWNRRAILQSPPPSTIETDASTMGWGACCGNFQIRGLGLSPKSYY